MRRAKPHVRHAQSHHIGQCAREGIGDSVLEKVNGLRIKHLYSLAIRAGPSPPIDLPEVTGMGGISGEQEAAHAVRTVLKRWQYHTVPDTGLSLVDPCTLCLLLLTD